MKIDQLHKSTKVAMLLLITSSMPFGSILSLIKKKNNFLNRKKANKRTKGRETPHLKCKIKMREKKCES